ncbi:hypothetical protein HKX48_002201, partial [Thoreauomyces humboldtii]
DIEGSVWSELSPMKTSADAAAAGNVHLDVQRFEELFCVVPGNDKDNSGKGKPKMVQRTQFTSLLDLRRANNVAIGLSRFTRRGLTTSDLIRAVSTMDRSVLSSDDLLMLQKLIPTAEEKQKLQAHFMKGPGEKVDGQQLPPPPLAPAEKFMSEIMSVRHIEDMCIAFLTHSTASHELDETADKLDTMISLSDQLRTSTNLKTLLRSVLELGNLTNYDYSANANSSFRPWMGKEARAIGLKLDGLARLKDVKSQDGKWSLMTFLVDMVAVSRNDVLDVPAEVRRVRVVAAWDLESTVRQFRQLHSTLQHLDVFRLSASPDDPELQTYVADYLNPVLDTVALRVADVTQKAAEFWAEFERLAKYLGEDLAIYVNLPGLLAGTTNPPPRASIGSAPRIHMPTHLYGMMNSFLRAYEEAVSAWRTRGGDDRAKAMLYKPAPKAAAAPVNTPAGSVNTPGSNDTPIVAPPPPPPPPLIPTVTLAEAINGSPDAAKRLPPPPEMARLFRRFSKRFLEDPAAAASLADTDDANKLPTADEENDEDRADDLTLRIALASRDDDEDPNEERPTARGQEPSGARSEDDEY